METPVLADMSSPSFSSPPHALGSDSSSSNSSQISSSSAVESGLGSAASCTSYPYGDNDKKRKAEGLSSSYSDQNGESVNEDDVRRILTPLSREQLVSVLTKACVQHSDVYNTAFAIVQRDPASRRLLVRNIAFATKDETFKALLNEYGPIEDFTIVRDRDTQLSKGFGFVTFTNLKCVEKILKDTVMLDGRELALKRAADPIVETAPSSMGKAKVFIRNLSDLTTDSKLQTEFSVFGYIIEAVVVKDAAGRSKGFGFVTFSKCEDAARAVQQPQRVIDGRMTFVTLASQPPVRHPIVPISGKRPYGSDALYYPPNIIHGAGSAAMPYGGHPGFGTSNPHSPLPMGRGRGAVLPAMTPAITKIQPSMPTPASANSYMTPASPAGYGHPSLYGGVGGASSGGY